VSEAVAEAPGDWRRTSPLGFVVQAIMALRNLALPALAAIFTTGDWDQAWLFVPLGLALGVAVIVAISYVQWRHLRYRLGESDIRLERGLLSRSARTVPYERIQDVSVEQALVPRLFGMVQVTFETGAGGKDELKLAYVTEAEGDALRETVRVRKAGELVPAGEEAGEAAAPAEESRQLFAMDSRRLLTFGLFEFSLVIFAVLGGAAQQLDFLLPFEFWDFDEWAGVLAGPGSRLSQLGLAVQVFGAIVALAALASIGLATGVVRTVLRDYGFRLEETPKGLRRRRGLLTRTDVVMPIHRVQALKLTTGIVRRRFGWYGLAAVSLAQDSKASSHVVVPFATMDEIAPVVAATGLALPDESAAWRRPSPRSRLDRALLRAVPLGLVAVLSALLIPAFPEATGFGVLVPLLLLALAGFFALREHFLWRYDRHALDVWHVHVRRGWLAPRLDIASRLKLQSVEIAQGPIARRRGYADVLFGVAGGKLEMHGIPLEDARAIRAAVLESIASVDFSALPR
jgi:putative membrane protein